MTSKVDFFSTANEENSRRIHYWNKISSQLVGSAAVCPIKRGITGSVERRNFGTVQVINIDSSPVTVESLGDKRFSGIFILRMKQGRCDLEQGNMTCSIDGNSLSIIRADEAYRIRSDTAHHLHIMYIPNKQLASRLSDYMAEPLLCREYQLLVSFIDKLASVDISKIAPNNLLSTALDLIEIEWPRKVQVQGKTNAGHRLEALHEYINFHLSNPLLSVDDIAESLHITPRYIQKLFAESGTTLTKTICEKRLLLARGYLLDTSRNITDIAIMSGFSDLSYFCRSFKRRFTISARDYRKREKLPANN